MQSANSLTRRTVLAGAAATAAMATFMPRALAENERIKKAVKFGMVGIKGSVKDKFALVKKLGFDGIELDAPSGLDKDEVLAARDEVGLPIHGVVNSVHWRKTLSDANPEVRAEGVKGLETAIRDCKLYGGSTVLLVPAVVNGRVSYKQAYERSQAEIKKVLPLAAELEITIAIENVWNNFLLSPLEAARYLDELESPWVGWYLDIGNIVRYGWPKDWVEALGKRLKKLDIKDFSRKKSNDEGLWKGFQADIGDGDGDWAELNKALAAIDWTGWGTAEVRGGDEARLTEIAKRMDDVYART
ncbi:MAG: sugar phosphate isomerase/epimerase family protein [Planctomycetota bacterium]|nr:sugar phosphate isomerase/epimerase family protein [Planctomycetota bacterium]